MQQEISPLFIALHAGLVVSGFVFMAIGTYVARKVKTEKWWLKAHKTLGITGASFAWAGFLAAVAMVYLSGNEHFRILHADLGLVIAFLALSSPLTGQMQIKFRSFALKMRILHHWSGRLMLALMPVNFALGLILL